MKPSPVIKIELTSADAAKVFVFLISYAALLRTEQIRCEVATCDQEEAERLAAIFRPAQLGDIPRAKQH